MFPAPRACFEMGYLPGNKVMMGQLVVNLSWVCADYKGYDGC
jgi:hypothetical protein